MLCKYKTTEAHSIPPTKVAKNACNLLANKVLDKNVVFKNTHTSFKTYI
jgi:DNA repair protein RadC